MERLVMVKVKIGNSLKVFGEFVLIHNDGTEEVINGKRSFCRCGRSGSQPFCDNTHREREKIEDEEAPF
jgi:CDGSH-type Zn-finger protein